MTLPRRRVAAAAAAWAIVVGVGIDGAWGATAPRGEELWAPVAIPPGGLIEAVNLAGHADLVEWGAGVLRRRDGRTGRPVWERTLDAAPGDDSAPEGSQRWPWKGITNDPPGAELLHPAPDLDGDRTGDLVWLSRRAPCILTLAGGVEGKGSLLWSYPAPADPAETRSGRVVGMPAVTEIDGDGTPDLIATFVADDPNTHSGLACWVEALSGRSGRPLWRHSIEGVRDAERAQPAVLITREGRPTVGVFNFSRYEWLGLNPSTGRPENSRYHIGYVPLRPARYVDLDGNGEPELITVHALHRFGGQEVNIRSLAPPWRPVWSENVGTLARDQGGFDSPRGGWPAVVDLDPAEPGRDVLVPDTWNRGVRAIRGADGSLRWGRSLRVDDESNNPSPFLIDGPDLDGDSIREVFAASFYWDQHRHTTLALRHRDVSGVYVDALSGRDGRPLWWWRHPLKQESPAFTHLQWWHAGPDGWPLLVLSVGHARNALANDDAAETFLIDAGSGRLRLAIEGLAWPRLADFDGDGRDDLWGVLGGKVHAFRGGPPGAWKPAPGATAWTPSPPRPDPRRWRRLPWVPVGAGPLEIIPTATVLALLVWIVPLRLLRRAIRDDPKNGRAVWGMLPLAASIVIGTYLAAPPRRLVGLLAGAGGLQFFLLPAALALGVLLLVGWLLWRRGVRLRFRYRVRLSPVLTIALAVAILEAAYIAAVVAGPPSGLAAGGLGLVGFLFVAALGLPFVAFLEELGTALVHRRVWRLTRLIGLVLLAASAIALVALAIDRRKMAPDEYYTWDGWPTIAYPATYGAGIVLLAARGIQSLARRIAARRDKGKGKIKADDLADL